MTGWKRKNSVLAFSLMLFLFAQFAPLLISLVTANPYHPEYVSQGTIPPDANTKPPTITIMPLENSTNYSQHAILFTVNVSVGKSSTASSRFLWEVYYQTDWLPNETIVYEFVPATLTTSPDETYTPTPTITEFSKTVNLTDIPEGSHYVIVYSRERGSYEKNSGKYVYGTINPIIYTYNFDINASSSVYFSVDTTAPCISLPSLKDDECYSGDVPLFFAVNETVSQISYVLDGQANVTLSGNTTLTALSYGEHNVTVYAVDFAGNVGSSETVSFNVAEPESFPTTAVAAASVAAVVVCTSVFLLYFRKRARTKHD